MKTQAHTPTSTARKVTMVLGLVGFLLLAAMLFAAFVLTESHTYARTRALIGAGVGLILAIVFLASNRRAVGQFFAGRQFAYGGNVALMVLFMAAILVVLNLIGSKYYASADWTRKGTFTLSSETRNIVKSLADDLSILVYWRDFSNDAPRLPRVRDLLARYERFSSQVKVRYVDPMDPGEGQKIKDKYHLSDTDVQVLILEYKGKTKNLARTDFFTYAEPPNPYMQEEPKEIFKGEDALTSAIQSLVEGKPPVVMFTTGFGERAIDNLRRDSNAYGLTAEAVRQNNMTCVSLPMFGRREIPDTCDVLVVAAPTKPYGATEAKAIQTFLRDRGGKAVFLLEPRPTERGDRVAPTGLEEVLREFGVDVEPTLVVDAIRRVPGGGSTVFFSGGPSYGSHPIMNALEGVTTVWPNARSLSEAKEHAGYTVTPLVRTSDRSWGEVDLQEFDEGAIRYDEGVDKLGPVTIAMAVSAESYAPPGMEPQGMKAVIFSNGDFISNGLADLGAANRDLFLNTLRWLTGRTSSMGIAPKEVDEPVFRSTSRQMTFVWAAAFMLAVLAVLAGLAVWIIRR